MKELVTNNDEDFTVDNDGQLTFTEKGIAEYRSYFGKAGIDIRNIKSMEDYYKARRAASPFFEDRLMARLNKGEQTLEMRILKAIAQGDDKEYHRLERLLQAKRKGITAI